MARVTGVKTFVWALEDLRYYCTWDPEAEGGDAIRCLPGPLLFNVYVIVPAGHRSQEKGVRFSLWLTSHKDVWDGVIATHLLNLSVTWRWVLCFRAPAEDLPSPSAANQGTVSAKTEILVLTENRTTVVQPVSSPYTAVPAR